jgi:RNA polymerase sigma-70 factor (ECF subfamily)
LPPLEDLYRSHGAAVLRRARELLGCEAEAQEVLHDVFASLLEKPEQFGGHSSAMTFLYRMTTNAALQRLRNRRTRQRLLASNHNPGAAVVSQAQEAQAELRQLVQTLPEDLAQIATYYYVDEMTQAEIAELLGCSRQWVSRRLEHLRRSEEGRP